MMTRLRIILSDGFKINLADYEEQEYDDKVKDNFV